MPFFVSDEVLCSSFLSKSIKMEVMPAAAIVTTLAALGISSAGCPTGLYLDSETIRDDCFITCYGSEISVSVVQGSAKSWAPSCVNSCPRPEGARRRDSRNPGTTFWPILYGIKIQGSTKLLHTISVRPVQCQSSESAG